MIKKFKEKLLKTLVILSIFTLIIGSIGCNSKNTNVTTQEETTKSVVDMAGRNVKIPTKIKSVYSISPIGTTFMYTLNPEKVAGLNSKISEAEAKYTNESYEKLPVLGGNFGQGQTMNKEEILKVKPDIILNMGDLTDSTVSDCDKVQEDLGIPVVFVTNNLAKMDEAYDFLGKVTGDTEKAKELGDYCKKTYSEISEIAGKIPEDKKVNVYYAEGAKGLQTDPKGSMHTELLELIGANNIADVAGKQGYGRGDVSMEQVLKWNPEVILVCYDQGFAGPTQSPYDVIMSDSNWSNIKAVKDKKTYVIPYMPYNWFDRPPSVIRILGAKWLGNLLYPDYYKYDIKADVKEFYDKFFHINITDEQYEEIIGNAK